MANAPAEIRLLIVEDVPQVAWHIRGLLTAQTTAKLFDVVTDGTGTVRQVEQLRPDDDLSRIVGSVLGFEPARAGRW